MKIKNFNFKRIFFIIVLTSILSINLTLTKWNISTKPIQRESNLLSLRLSQSSETTWMKDGIPICTAEINQDYPVICSDGARGAILAWRDNRHLTDWDIYAQRVDSNGNTLWVVNGTPVTTELNNQHMPEICSDGANGAVIVWHDFRSNSHWDIYAQRVDSNGNVLWTPNGTIITNAIGEQNNYQICSDGTGGVIVVWQDSRNLIDWNIFAQRIDANGNVAWMVNGTPICTAGVHQQYPELCSDGAGGAIFTWRDQRALPDLDIYVQKVDGDGNVLWMPNGTRICSAEISQDWPKICSDGAGGAILTWRDNRHLTDWDIYAQRIDSNGNGLWIANGTPITTELFNQDLPEICSDGANGAIIAWYDLRNELAGDIYAQRVNLNGNAMWMTNGTPICLTNVSHDELQICSDNKFGAIITWQDDRNSTHLNIFAQRVDANGNMVWMVNGTPICTADRDQSKPKLCSDGIGGAFFTWRDNRDATDWNIYAQYIKGSEEMPGFPFEIVIISVAIGSAAIIAVILIIWRKRKRKD